MASYRCKIFSTGASTNTRARARTNTRTHECMRTEMHTHTHACTHTTTGCCVCTRLHANAHALKTNSACVHVRARVHACYICIIHAFLHARSGEIRSCALRPASLKTKVFRETILARYTIFVFETNFFAKFWGKASNGRFWPMSLPSARPTGN